MDWPAHVALKADDQWHAPGTVEYQDAYSRHDPELRWLGAFIAAGFVLQTTAMVAVVGGMSLAGSDAFAVRLVRISMVVNGLYLFGDLVATGFARAPAGDMSSLLRHTPWVGGATLVFVVGVHFAAGLAA